ncbi:DUF3137 domain-containing protein [Paenibacillus sp. 1P07SE]|uniref:DUF3137 domain-containing protein n=1 Tax=Paenibacillus sp. 1P07SE TaxID=3132209 RepID=UPI0039A58069
MFPAKSDVARALQSRLPELEEARAAYKRIFLNGIVTILAAAAGTLIVFLSGIPEAILVTAAVAVIAIVVMVVRMNRRYREYRDRFKQQIVRGVARELVAGCRLPDETPDYEYAVHYDQYSRISDNHIDGCLLFDERIDRIEGEDLIKGKLGLTDFEFSELHLRRVERNTGSNGHTTTRHVTVFEGVLFVADFHKSFRGVTLLLANGWLGAGGFFNKLGNKMSGLFSRHKMYNIDLENPAFNRYFDTNTSDEVEARYLLSPNFMERILGFKSWHDQKVEFAFVGSRMYVAISSKSDYFEPTVRQSTERQMERVYDELIFFFSLIEHFDLNTRIWSKS